MKSILIILFISISLTSVAQNTGIRFTNNELLTNAIKKAKTENKLIFLDCLLHGVSHAGIWTSKYIPILK